MMGMAKVETVERFNIIAEADTPEMMGRGIAALTREGFSKIRYELVTDVLAYKNKPTHEISTAEFLASWIKDHVHFKAIEAVKAFRADGRGSGNVAYPALGDMVEKGILKKVGPGEYARADQKALPAPEKNKANKANKASPKHFDKSATEMILSLMRRNHGRSNAAKLTEIFAAQGRARGSVSSAIDKLIKHKMIKRTESGSYLLLAKGQTARKKEIDAKKPKANGNGAQLEAPETEATHGV
jgi:hypothetical protein